MRFVQNLSCKLDIGVFFFIFVLACRFEVDAKRKLVEEPEASKRLEILKSELETRLFEQNLFQGSAITRSSQSTMFPYSLCPGLVAFNLVSSS